MTHFSKQKDTEKDALMTYNANSLYRFHLLVKLHFQQDFLPWLAFEPQYS